MNTAGSTVFVAPLGVLLLAMCTAAATELTFDYSWRFHLGDPQGVHPAVRISRKPPRTRLVTRSRWLLGRFFDLKLALSIGVRPPRRTVHREAASISLALALAPLL